MRIIVLLLALANLTLLAYTQLDRIAGGEPNRLERQINPGNIKLLSPQQVAALGPSKAATLPNVCLEWGPFPESDRARVIAILQPFQLGRLLATRRVEYADSFWTFVPPAANRANADRQVGDLRRAGYADAYVIDNGPQRHAIALGVFRNEEAARRMAEVVRGKGFNQATHGPRGAPLAQTIYVVRDPQPGLLGKVRETSSEFTGAEMKTGPCPEGTQ